MRLGSAGMARSFRNPDNYKTNFECFKVKKREKPVDLLRNLNMANLKNRLLRGGFVTYS